MWTNWRQGVQGSVVFLEFIICPSGISRCPFPLFLRVHRSSSRCEGEARDFSTLMRDFVSERMILYIQIKKTVQKRIYHDIIINWDYYGQCLGPIPCGIWQYK